MNILQFDIQQQPAFAALSINPTGFLWVDLQIGQGTGTYGAGGNARTLAGHWLPWLNL
jgi:hypothetical protein